MYMKTCPSNLMSVDLTTLELLAFNSRKFSVHATLATPIFEQFLRCHVRTIPGNTRFKFRIRNFNCFGAINILRPKI